jgi:transposase
MYVETVPNRGSRPAVLLREAWREGQRIRKRTLANLTDWPAEQIESLRRVLKGETLVPADKAFVIERSLPHGHVEAVLLTMRRLGLAELLSSHRCRERDLVLAMLVEQVIAPCSKLATTRLWHSTTLAAELGVADADEDELYAALDWLLARQPRLEQKLARRHLGQGSLVLYDVSSSYFEGRKCPLAQYGHDRDGKRGKAIIVYGVMTDGQGRPVAVEVYPGNTGDPTTVADQVQKLRERFGLSRVVLAGDRGMLTETQITKLQQYPGLGWISALRSPAIRELVESRQLQMSLFDERNLAEIMSPAYPGERLIACRNPYLAVERARKRQELLAVTEQALQRISREVKRRRHQVLTAGEIGLKVGRVIHRHKMAKHFRVEIGDGRLTWIRDEETIARESALDGIYVIRTSEARQSLTAEDTVRTYKGLSQVERLFRTLKGIDLRVRPIRHRTAAHVRAHVFLCTLAYYIEWHLRRALAPLLFDDEELPEERKRRDPVAPAQPSASARSKKATRVTDDGLPVHSYQTLLEELATRCRNRCRAGDDPAAAAFDQVTRATPLQARVLELLGSYPVGRD